MSEPVIPAWAVEKAAEILEIRTRQCSGNCYPGIHCQWCRHGTTVARALADAHAKGAEEMRAASDRVVMTVYHDEDAPDGQKPGWLAALDVVAKGLRELPGEGK